MNSDTNPVCAHLPTAGTGVVTVSVEDEVAAAAAPLTSHRRGRRRLAWLVRTMMTAHTQRERERERARARERERETAMQRLIV